MKRLTRYLPAGLITFLVISWVSQARAMTESWSAIDGRYLTFGDGTVGLSSGSKMEIGILGSNTVAMLQSLQHNPIALEAAFVDWATGYVGDGTGVDGTFTIASFGPGAGFFSTQIYLLVFSAPTAASANWVGLFTNPAWIFPASDAAPANSLDLSEPGLVAVIGSLTTGTIISPAEIAGGDAANLGIPEPATVTLVVFGLLSVMGFIRRSRG